MKKTRPCCKCFTKCRRQQEAFPSTAQPRASSPATTKPRLRRHQMVLPREGSLSARAVLGGKQQSSRRGGQQPPVPPLLMQKGFVPRAQAVQGPGASRTLCSAWGAPRGPGFHAGSGLGLCLSGWGQQFSAGHIPSSCLSPGHAELAFAERLSPAQSCCPARLQKLELQIT